MDKAGVEKGRLHHWKVRKGSDGVWRLHGDQRTLDIEFFPAATKNYAAGQACFTSTFIFAIQNHNKSNDGGAIAYLLITGPGLPSAGLRYEEPALGGRFVLAGAQSGNNYHVASNCAWATAALTDTAIAAIPDDAVYTVSAFDRANGKITFPSGSSDGSYQVKIQRRPMTLAEAVASQAYPLVSAETLGALNALNSAQGGTLTVTASNLYALSDAYVHLWRDANNGTQLDRLERTVAPTPAGTISSSLVTSANSAAASSYLLIEGKDAYRRSMQALYKR